MDMFSLTFLIMSGEKKVSVLEALGRGSECHRLPQNFTDRGHFSAVTTPICLVSLIHHTDLSYPNPTSAIA